MNFKDKRTLALFGLTFFFIVFFPTVPPSSFPSNSIITIAQGSGLDELSKKLKDDGVIRSRSWFRIAALILDGETGMKAGQYFLARPQNTFVIAWRIFHGDYGIKLDKLTIPEGFTIREIANLFAKELNYFNQEDFIRQAPEGYLFPDTYFMPANIETTSAIEMMRNNFDRQITAVEQDLDSSGKKLSDVITMASIIEKEAKTVEDRKIISGILWSRLNMGIPLQVDASFAYVNGKTTKDLTQDDLKIDSPYNTYLYKGLPPTPISNPGMKSIIAALHPTSTPYLYFLTADDGTMHYSKTFEEHVAKKLKYIKKR